MQSVHLGAMGPGILWYFMEDELLLTHPGLACAGERAGSIPTTHSSYILGHIPLPLWSPTPGKAGATSLPHYVIHSSSSLPPQHWQSGLKPVCPPPYLGEFCTPPGWELWLVGLCLGFRACPAVSALRSGPVGLWEAGTERDHRDPPITALHSKECHIQTPC